MNTEDKTVDTTALNDQIIRLWSEYFGNSEKVYAPFFYKPLKQSSLAYVGVNPSFSVPAIERIAQGTEYEGIDAEKFFNWQEVKNNISRIADLIRFEDYASQKYSLYFKPMHEFAENTNLPPQPLETFLYRCTSQKEFTQLILEKGEFNSFGKAQIKIFFEVLSLSRPKVIVVANAFASRMIRDEFQDHLSFDNDLGFHWLTLGTHRSPIFFSSMLTGQRALDLGSYERLKWHITKASQATQ